MERSEHKIQEDSLLEEVSGGLGVLPEKKYHCTACRGKLACTRLDGRGGTIYTCQKCGKQFVYRRNMDGSGTLTEYV